MTIFDLHSQVLSDYRDFIPSFLAIANEHVWAVVEEAPKRSSALNGGIER